MTMKDLKELISTYGYRGDKVINSDLGYCIDINGINDDRYYVSFDSIYVDDNDDRVVLYSSYHETSFYVDDVLGVENGNIIVKVSIKDTIFEDKKFVLDTSKTYHLSIYKIKKLFTNLVDNSITECN